MRPSLTFFFSGHWPRHSTSSLRCVDGAASSSQQRGSEHLLAAGASDCTSNLDQAVGIEGRVDFFLDAGVGRLSQSSRRRSGSASARWSLRWAGELYLSHAPIIGAAIGVTIAGESTRRR
jgi:hypothetical protein